MRLRLVGRVCCGVVSFFVLVAAWRFLEGRPAAAWRPAAAALGVALGVGSKLVTTWWARRCTQRAAGRESVKSPAANHYGM
jgi:hypothetical protein